MKKLIVLAVAVIGIQFAASAQEKRDSIRSHHKSEARAKMKSELNLSNEQVSKMKEIQKETNGKMQALKEDKSLSDQDRKAKRMAIMKESMEKRNAVLTPEQREKMKQWKEKNKGHWKDGKKHHGGKMKGKKPGEKPAEKTQQ